MNDPTSIGPYQVIHLIGKGGMGEVFMAYDPICRRQVAIKRIRKDKDKENKLRKRFLREAFLTAQLTHPSIIPIYSINEELDSTYYVMPFVEGRTLKDVLIAALHKQQEGQECTEGTIPYLVRIFINVCQAIAYAHSKGVLHRDLKPEHVMIGKYGHVLILDWGLIKQINDDEDDKKPHKVIGTLGYLAPERANGAKATIASDIYALGVMLYQILTLHSPFNRPSAKWFLKHRDEETLKDPVEVAPLRDIPEELVFIAQHCLEKRLTKRYASVDALITDLESYWEGKPLWILSKELKIDDKSDWEFQENVLIPECLAISNAPVETNWMNLMVSSQSFCGNTKIEMWCRLKDHSHGIGIMLSVPSKESRTKPTDGICLWLGNSTKLFRSAIEALDLPDVSIPRNQWLCVTLEKIDHTLTCRLNEMVLFKYISYLPLIGTHVGVLYRDTEFEVDRLAVFLGSSNLQVSCLAVPDAFLARGQYNDALGEYRRIAYSFSGRTESREALFRSGITLLEMRQYEQALGEFQKLRLTAGAPLEYLGKALVYQRLRESEEEAKCLELALCKYPHHPLISLLHHHLFFRLHDSSRHDRQTAYRLALIACTHLYDQTKQEEHKKLFLRLKKYWEKLPFLEDLPEDPKHDMIIPMAFWLNKIALLELLSTKLQGTAESNCLYCLKMLGLTISTPLPHDIRSMVYDIECAIDQEDYKKAEQLCMDDSDAIECYRIFCLLHQKKWDEAKKALHYHPEDLFQSLFGIYLAAVDGEKAAMRHFQTLLPKSHPPTWLLCGYYLTMTESQQKQWQSSAFSFEKQMLQRQLKLYYSILGKRYV